MDLRVFVFTCDKYLWCLRPFAYLFNRYWSELQEVVVAGYKPPDFPLPANFSFHSISPNCYPAEKWSNGVIEFLHAVNDDIFVLMLEDYWLTRGVDHQAVGSLADYMRLHPKVVRLDLTTDRLYSGRAEDVESWGRLDLIETPPDSPYQFSLQACLVNRALVLKCLKPNLSPWDVELNGGLLKGYRVLGTRQWPVRYVIGVGTGHKGINVEGIPKEHLNRMKAEGYFEGQNLSSSADVQS